MLPADYIGKVIFDAYVVPSCGRGESTVTIRPGEVYKALDGTYRLSFIHGVLSSMKFRNTYHLPLVGTEGPALGPPTAYTFKLSMVKSLVS